MTSTRVVGLLAVTVVIGLAVAPAASGALAHAADGDADSTGGGEPNATVTTFMQSTAADAEHSIESGVFEAAYENAAAEQRDEIVADRVADLEDELATLEGERERLRSADNRTGAYQARMTKLAVEISALERSIEQAEPRAAEAGVDDERLETLRANASALADDDVAATAQGIPGLERQPGGPPADRGPNAATPGADTGGPSEQATENQTPPGQAGNQAPPGQVENQTPGQAGNQTSGNQGPPDRAGDGAAPGADRGSSNTNDANNGNANNGDSTNGDSSDTEGNGSGSGVDSPSGNGPDHERDRSKSGNGTGNSDDGTADSSDSSDKGNGNGNPADGTNGNSGNGETGGNDGNGGTNGNNGNDTNHGADDTRGNQ